MRQLVFLSVLLIPFVSGAQERLQLNLFGGFSNYQGDLQGKPFTLEQSNGAFGVGLSYYLTPHFLVRAGLVTGKVKASDKLNKPSLQLRNLDFQTRISEGHAMLEYDLFDLSEKKLTPYVFAGLAVYHFNPYTFDSTGAKVMLRPLSTEGQGLSQYPNRKPYRLTQLAIPVGGGLKLRLSDNVAIAYEIGLRKLSTDYLDDVSSSYVDKTALFAAKGSKAVELAYRGDEVKNGMADYPVDGTRRGSPTMKDWYYFHGITLSIGLNAKGGGRGSRYGCPAGVL
ncbi:MAG: outer membrane beta-barrel protein [Williamsia sp.]|nr:outer membrane beta-barrel protein [Williamsia sp.]